MLELTIEGDGSKKLNFEVQKLVNAGRSARDITNVRKHMEELRKTGITIPDEFPIFNLVTPERITTGDHFEVLMNSKTSGEVEFVLLLDNGNVYVSVGSDHTDRELQKTNKVAAKQIYYNVIAPTVWRFEDVKEYWDDLIMRSWVQEKGQRQLYQEGKLVEMLRPEKLIEEVNSRVTGGLSGMVIFSGTLPTLSGELSYSSRFDMELIDERAGRAIKHTYFAEPITWFKGKWNDSWGL